MHEAKINQTERRNGNRTSKCMKQKLIKLKGEMENSTVKFGDFNIPLSVINRTGK